MKTIIQSIVTKYMVNVLLIVAFGVSAATGLIKPGGEHFERSHDFRSEQVTQANEIFTAGFSTENFENISENTSVRSENNHENIHVYFGLILLGLMLFHTIQHWPWFKKFFSLKHLLKNKLLSVTVIVFVLMSVSGLIMWTELIPRELINFREIHEITGQLLLVLMLIHIVQRVKWYVTIPARHFKRNPVLA